MVHILNDLKSFLESSPTSWHAAQQVGNRLASQDFIPLIEEEKWNLEKGKNYFVAREGSLCAFCLPSSTLSKMTLLASHTDSPALKLKPFPEKKVENMILFGVEIYGGPLLSSWLNRDLGIAGRVMISNSCGDIEKRLVFIDDAPLFIPQLAIHLDKEVNEKGLLLNKQDHLFPIASLVSDKNLEKNYLETLLRRHISFESLLSFDLFLVPLDFCRFLGGQGELLASYRLDNLISVHASSSAIARIKHPSPSHLQMSIFWDHEEVGSRTMEGASSSFLMDVLKRIHHFFGLDEEEWIRIKRRSHCISIDMAHALNPNYPSKYDPSHQPLLGKGIVLKYNSDCKYASSALSVAGIIRSCQKLGLSYQSFVSRNDVSCGSTVGPILAHQLGIPVVDIGCPQLSMHSTREVMACEDYLDMNSLLTFLLQEESL